MKALKLNLYTNMSTWVQAQITKFNSEESVQYYCQVNFYKEIKIYLNTL